MRIRNICVAFILLSALSGCDDNPEGPSGGAGLRLVFPEEFGTLHNVRIQLVDADQSHPAFSCDEFLQRKSRTMSPDSLSVCNSLEFTVSDLVGKRIRRWVSGDVIWDGRGEDGNPVPAGYYFYRARCLDPQDDFDVRQGIYLADLSACEWPLWSDEMDRVRGGEHLEFAPFPETIELPVTEPGSPDVIGTITFENPFRIRVQAAGRQAFEHEVRLVEGQYAEVEVRLVPD